MKHFYYVTRFCIFTAIAVYDFFKTPCEIFILFIMLSPHTNGLIISQTAVIE